MRGLGGLGSGRRCSRTLKSERRAGPYAVLSEPGDSTRCGARRRATHSRSHDFSAKGAPDVHFSFTCCFAIRNKSLNLFRPRCVSHPTKSCFASFRVLVFGLTTTTPSAEPGRSASPPNKPKLSARIEGHLEATTRQTRRWQKSGGVVAAPSRRECRTAEVSRPSCWASSLGGPLLLWASVATGMPSDTALSGPVCGRPAGAPTPIWCRTPHHLQPRGVLSFWSVRFSGLPLLRLGGASSSSLIPSGAVPWHAALPLPQGRCSCCR